MIAIRLHIFVSATRHVAGSSVLLLRLAAFHLSPLLLHLSYFVAVDLLGFLSLLLLRPAAAGNAAAAARRRRPRYVDMLFLSTSAVTVTGLATVRMEDLSASQLVVLTLQMLMGSEMFVSLLGLALELLRDKRELLRRDRHDDVDGGRARSSSSVVVVCDEPDDGNRDEEASAPAPPPSSSAAAAAEGSDDRWRKSRSLRCLALVLLAYMAVVTLLGSVLVFAYVDGVQSARDVLARKRIGAALFSAAATVSSFTNGGLLPTNESMAVFAADRGLLLLLAGQVLAGSTLLPVFLWLAVRAARGVTRVFAAAAGRRRHEHDDELEFMERSAMAAGFGYLLPGSQTAVLAATVVSLAAAAAVLFCSLDWDSAVFAGLAAGDKVANAVFMAVNARQAGENSVDCSLVAPAVLVLFVAMMFVELPRSPCSCIPASATLFSVHRDDDDGGGGGETAERKDGAPKKRRLTLNSMVLSPLACNAAVTMVVCITERKSLADDPHNFSTFNMIFEVISAYGNVGLSTGYSCSRLLRPPPATGGCHDQPYSFSGWWSDQGKLVLVIVMLYGRLKGFHRQSNRR
ncbi:hypothetical protein ACP4OV_013733 [Aristida adscensionis]